MKVDKEMFLPLYCDTNGSYFPSLIPVFNVNVIRATAGRMLIPVSHNVSQSVFIVFLKTINNKQLYIKPVWCRDLGIRLKTKAG